MLKFWEIRTGGIVRSEKVPKQLNAVRNFHKICLHEGVVKMKNLADESAAAVLYYPEEFALDFTN